MTAYAVRYIGPPLQGADGPGGWEVAERGCWRAPETAEERTLVSRCIRIAAASPRGWPDAAGTAFIGARGVDVEQLGELEVVAISWRPVLVPERLAHQLGEGPRVRVADEARQPLDDVNGPVRRAFAERLHAAGWRADVLGDAEETARGAALMLRLVRRACATMAAGLTHDVPVGRCAAPSPGRRFLLP